MADSTREEDIQKSLNNSETAKLNDLTTSSTEKDDAEPADKELDDLLDSALEDFDKPIPTASKNAEAGGTASAGKLVNNEIWTDEFLKQATAHFEDAMKNFISDETSFSDDFRRMAEATGRSLASQDSEQELAESLSQTLRGLAENAEAISNPLTDEEITNLLGNLGLTQDIEGSESGCGDLGESGGGGNGGGCGGGGAEPDDLINIMKNVMQNLLSKELLYPALKEITDKYPKWLADNRSTLKTEEYDKYTEQYEFMKMTCEEFEMENECDAADVKKARFEKILDLMQKMQECGHPPKELIGDMGQGFEMDQHGNPRLPGLPMANAESCSVM